MASSAPAPGAIPALPPVPHNIATITSPLLFGILSSWACYGILVVQVYLYYLCFPSDKRAFKFLVYCVFLLDTLQTILTGVDAWYWFGVGYGNMNKLSNPFISAFDTPLLGSVIAVIVQSFFSYRIFSLSRSWVLTGFIIAFALAQGVAGCVSAVQGHIVGNFAQSQAYIDPAALYIWLIGSVITDTLVAVSMSWLLIRAKHHEHQQTSDVVSSIVRLTIETNSLSAGIAILCLIMYFAAPNRNYYICPTFLIGKVYSNTLLVAFNNRFFLTRQNPSSHISTAPSLTSRSIPGPAIHIRTNQEVITDRETFNESYKLEDFNNVERISGLDNPPPEAL